ncbi:Ig-like domain-containing protein [Paenibacillus sp. JSM ZJ436]|uniref:Ig-like domain-containing protein n=1 Tax=Paenibacillus sp. JSM ZJ436 TaxID=3376190 RepID=UPI0037947A86
MINLFDHDNQDYAFLMEQFGTDVLVNNNPTQAMIDNTNLEQEYDDKKISSLSPLHRGDIVIYEDNKYLLVSEVNGQRYDKYKGIMRRLPHTITVNAGCRFIALDCFITVGNSGITDGKVLSIQDGEITVYTTQYYNDSGLKIDTRFILYGQAFKIVGIDRFSQPGIMIIRCEQDSINPATDDVVNGIAGALSCPVNIIDIESSVYVGSTFQLEYTSTNNAPVTFSSTDESIATVSNTGLVTAIRAGVVTIRMYNATRESIQDFIIVTVEEIPASYTVTITSTESTPTEILKNKSKTYNATVYNGADITTGKTILWEMFADDKVATTALAVITSRTNNSCVVRGDNLGYVQLKVSLVDDPSVHAWYRIRIKSAL